MEIPTSAVQSKNQPVHSFFQYFQSISTLGILGSATLEPSENTKSIC